VKGILNIMTDNKDLKYTQQFKPEPYIPQTETRIILEQQDLYPDLGYEDISSQRGYGPCKGCGREKKKFKLAITLKNRAGSTINQTVEDVDDAISAASDIIGASGHWEGTLSTGSFSTSTRKNLSRKINDKIKEHTKGDGEIVIASVVNDTQTNE
jgi:hypothetical protein